MYFTRNENIFIYAKNNILKYFVVTKNFNTYSIPSITNSTKINKIYKENKIKDEENICKIYDKELVAFPYDEETYEKLLNIERKRKERNISDFYFNSNIYINVENEQINKIDPSHFDLKNIEKCFIFEKEYLNNFFIEGLSGELPKDILMHNDKDDNYYNFINELKKKNLYNKKKKYSNIKGIGLLYRKLTHEIINEMKYCENEYKLKKERDSYKLDNYFLLNNQSYYNINSGYEHDTNNMNEKKKFQRRSILIDGKRGVGKSCILNNIVLWAKLNNWFVIFIPDIKKYKFEINTIVRSNTNLYIQPELSRQFLENLVNVNGHFLKELKAEKIIINNTCLDGTHIMYTKKIYDDIIRKAISTEIEENYKQLNEKDQNLIKQKLYKFYYDNIKIPNLLDKFSKPSNLLELANIGINNSVYANLCVYAIFEHLKKQDKYPILIAVDQFNFNLSVSEYLSIRFENTKYNAYIPTYFFTIPKLLIQWNTQNYKRCFKIVSTCWDRENRRNFQPQFLGINKKEIKTVRNFNLREFKNYISHLYNQNIIYNFDINKLEYFYMLTSGNGFQARKLLTTLY